MLFRSGGFLVRPSLDLYRLVERRGCREGDTLTVVDDLGIDVLARAEDAEARTAVRSLTQRITRATLATGEQCFGVGHVGSPLLLLAFFAADRFRRVLDAFALVGLGRTERTDLGRQLGQLVADGGRQPASDVTCKRPFEIVIQASPSFKQTRGGCNS